MEGQVATTDEVVAVAKVGGVALGQGVEEKAESGGDGDRRNDNE